MSEREPLGSGAGARDYGAAAVPPVGFADFSPTELYSLSESIAGDVERVNSSLRALNKMLRQVGGPGDSLSLRDNIHGTQQSVNVCVAGTARDLQRLGVVVRRGDKPQKLQVERLTHAFKEALSNYSTLQKQLREKMQANMPQAQRPRPSSHMLEPTADDEDSTLLASRQAQARLIEFETSMLLEREAYVSKIEADVIDVNQIMAQLADIVSSQGATIDTVESQVEAAGSRVEAGADELAKAAGYQAKYRRKVLLLAAIALLVAIVLVVIIVRSVR